MTPDMTHDPHETARPWPEESHARPGYDPVEEHQAQSARALATASERLAEAHARLDRLRVRLQPILLPDADAPEAALVAERSASTPPRSPVAHHAWDIATDLERLNVRLGDLTDLVDL